MKGFLIGLMMLFSVTANATMINGVEYGEGLTLQTGSVFFNTGTIGQDDPVMSEGIGQILGIYSGQDLIWQHGDNGVEYNMVFDSIELTAFDGPNIFGSVSYGDIGGNVLFFSNEIGTFNPSGDFQTDASNIADNGTLNLAATGHEVFGYTVTGSADDDSNGGQGQLDVMGGEAFDLIIQDSLVRLDQTFADMTFNFSADNLQTAGYMWSGSVDLAVTTVEVSEPPTGLLLSLGLGMIGFLTGGRTVV
jgi:hypothetical protein